MNFLKRLTFLTIFLAGLSSCENNRWKVDLGTHESQFELGRFELDLFQHSANMDSLAIAELKKKYPHLLPLYSQAIMRFGELEDLETILTFEKFTSDVNILELYEAVKEQYPENSLQVESALLSDAFARYQYHFEGVTIPQLRTMISAFTYSTVVDEDLLVIGLDNYLGADFKLYPQAGIPEYKFKHFSKEYMVADAMKAWLLTDFPSDEAQNLLEQMIYNGKIIYLCSALLPELEEHILFDYHVDELLWCQENSEEIWSHFLEFELLFNTENHKIRKYMGDAPFIPGFPEGSPGRVGQWLGYEIVKEFMDRNKDLELKDLMELADANEILRRSKYKPA